MQKTSLIYDWIPGFLSYEKWDVYRRRPPPPFSLAAPTLLRTAMRFNPYRAGMEGEWRIRSRSSLRLDAPAVVYKAVRKLMEN